MWRKKIGPTRGDHEFVSKSRKIPVNFIQISFLSTFTHERFWNFGFWDFGTATNNTGLQIYHWDKIMISPILYTFLISMRPVEDIGFALIVSNLSDFAKPKQMSENFDAAITFAANFRKP